MQKKPKDSIKKKSGKATCIPRKFPDPKSQVPLASKQHGLNPLAELPSDSTAKRLRQAAVLQIQRTCGNKVTGNILTTNREHRTASSLNAYPKIVQREPKDPVKKADWPEVLHPKPNGERFDRKTGTYYASKSTHDKLFKIGAWWIIVSTKIDFYLVLWPSRKVAKHYGRPGKIIDRHEFAMFLYDAGKISYWQMWKASLRRHWFDILVATVLSAAGAAGGGGRGVRPKAPSGPRPPSVSGRPPPVRPTGPKPIKPSAPKPAKPSGPKPAKPSGPKPAKPSGPKPAKPSGPKAVKPAPGGTTIPRGPAPSRAVATADHAAAKGGAARAGYRGGGKFTNDGRGGGKILPKHTASGKPITYKEYDVHPYVKGVDRGMERVVIGSDGSVYWTTDHYITFIKFR